MECAVLARERRRRVSCCFGFFAGAGCGCVRVMVWVSASWTAWRRVRKIFAWVGVKSAWVSLDSLVLVGGLGKGVATARVAGVVGFCDRPGICLCLYGFVWGILGG